MFTAVEKHRLSFMKHIRDVFNVYLWDSYMDMLIKDYKNDRKQNTRECIEWLLEERYYPTDTQEIQLIHLGFI
jgi:hypothetical protein